jgi:GT2 family glycosyltransferase
MAPTPEIAVAVASHDRPLRLRWLLNALEEQTLAPERFEVVVAHDSRGAETEELLRTHPLAARGTLRHVALPPVEGPARNRNASWRATRAPLVAFTDDDCRPPADWLERALEAAARTPGAIVQGTTMPDPDEADHLWASPHALTQRIVPPTPWAETCNIVYPRAVLERLGGFAEDAGLVVGEDTDLALRAQREGVPLVPAPGVLTWHAVEPASLARRIRWARRWGRLPALARRNPEFRRHLVAGAFWKHEHARAALGLAGLALARRRPAAALLALPWVAGARPSYGSSARGIARSVSEIPGHLAIDVAELAVLALGSVRHRSLVL